MCWFNVKLLAARLSLIWVAPGALLALAGAVRVCPAPAGEELSKDISVQVEGKEAPVYLAKVTPANPALRWKGMDDKAHSVDYFEKASFA
jgi:hypothetical protein